MPTKAHRIFGVVIIAMSAAVYILLGIALPDMYFLDDSLGALWTLFCLGSLTIAMAGVFIFFGSVWSRQFVYCAAVLGFAAVLGLVALLVHFKIGF